MSTVADKLSKLSPEQRALLEKKLRAKRQSTQNQSKIAPRSDQTSFPLSAGQQRLWYLEQLDPGSAAYNLTDAFHLTGSLDVACLTRSLELTCIRHETLRAHFETVDGAPMQVVAPKNQVNLTLASVFQQIDLQKYDVAERLDRAAQLANFSDNQPFSLTKGPLWRVTLVRLGEEEHVLIFTIHHMIADGWSLGLFTTELSEYYATLTNGNQVDVAELPIQYADYAAWQSQWLADERAEKQLAHWSEKLSGKVEPLSLPVSKRESASSHKGMQAKSIIPQHLIDAAQQLCRKNELSLFVFLISAFEATLHRYTEQQEMMICTPVVSRRQVELEKLIGYFNNIVALRSSLTGDMTFIDLLQQNKQVVLDAYEYQDLPFHLVTELPNLVRVPLSRALIALADADDISLTLPSITVEALQFSEDSADFDWSLFLNRTADGLSCELVYKSDLFTEEVANGFLHDYQQVIKQILTDSTLPLAKLTVAKPNVAGNQILDVSFNSGVNGTSMNGTGMNGTGVNDVGVSGSGVSSTEYEEPIGEYETNLAAVWSGVLGIDRVGRNQNFFELGGHSMLAVRLFGQIEKQITGSSVPLSLLLQAPTVAQMAKALQGDTIQAGFSLVVPIQLQGSKPPIFFIHPAGGNVLFYVDLAKHLAEHDQPSYGVQSQGLDGKLPILETVEEMAEVYVSHILRTRPQGPYLLSGYCLGGTIALAVAQCLEKQGHEVAFLGLLETYNWAELEEESLADALQYQSQRVEYHLRNFMLLDGDGKQTFLKEKAKVARDRSSVWAGSVKSIFGKEGIEESARTEDVLLSKIWEMNDIASEAYVPTAYAGKITQFVPKQDYAAYDDPRLGWSDIALGGVDKRRLPVYPAGMLIEPFVKDLAAEMAQCIDDALNQ